MSRPIATPRPLPMRPETIRRKGAPPHSAHTHDTTIFVRDLEVMARIGVHPHEHGRTQRILVDVELDMGPLPAPKDDRLAGTVDYEALSLAVEDLARREHTQLVETLAHRILDWCFRDERVQAARVSLSKPEALTHAGAAGCTVRRLRAS